MKEQDIEQLWQTNNSLMEQTITVNPKSVSETTQRKISSALASVKSIKILALVTGILWILFVDSLIIHFVSNPNLRMFVISAIIHSLLTKIAIGHYLYHLIQLWKIDATKNVKEVQTTIARLKTSTLTVARLMWVQLPLFTIFHLNPTMLTEPNYLWWSIQLVITILLAVAGVWLFTHIKIENRHQRWFRRLFSSKEWTALQEAGEILEQMED